MDEVNKALLLKRHERAKRIREVIGYLRLFSNALLVIHIDDKIMTSKYLASHIRDISLIRSSGIRVAVVPGAKGNIDDILQKANISWDITREGIRITKDNAMPLIKMAAFDSANTVMTSLAANQTRALIGNYVRARGIGVHEGIDYKTAGLVDKIETEAVNRVLEAGFVPIFPCIGWSEVGKPYNISSLMLATKLACDLRADKLFFITSTEGISGKCFAIPENIGTQISGTVPAMSMEELDDFLSLNKDKADNSVMKLLELSKDACRQGVKRVHIVSGVQDGAIVCEIFSDLGSGTMLYSQGYGRIRAMTPQDTTAALQLMEPFVQSGKLLSRTQQELLNEIDDYVVFELDGLIRACAALHIYEGQQAEIAAVAVDEAFSNIGIGPKLIEYLLEKAKSLQLKSVFILTTQASDWFQKLGFEPTKIQTLPEARLHKLLQSNRGSKPYRIRL